MARVTKVGLRRTALSVARAELRSQDIEPELASLQQVYEALNEYAMRCPNSDAAHWYHSASDNQFRLFDQDFRRWQKERREWAREAEILSKFC